MDTLPLDLISLLPLDEPFTTAAAHAVGIDKRALTRLHDSGSVVRVLRGVHASASASLSPCFRAAAVGLALGSRPGVVVDRTAGWLHGLPLELPVPLEVTRTRSLSARDVQSDPFPVTTPLRTALDLGRALPPAAALAALDGLLRGGLPLVALLADLPRVGGLPGAAQLRHLAPLADGRAECPAESVLRLRWLEADLPTPVPGALVVAQGRLVRLALALPDRRFGVVVAGRLPRSDLAALAAQGWRVVVATDRQALGAPEPVVRHLVREFHQHLLDQVG